MCVPTVFNLEMMEPELFRKFLKIAARGIADVGPDDVAILQTQLANVS